MKLVYLRDKDGKIIGVKTLEQCISDKHGNILTDKLNDINNIKVSKEELNVQKSRIDKFTSLTSGSTTGDAELQDIRIKDDGAIALSAGDAIREQVHYLRNNLNKIGDRLKSFDGCYKLRDFNLICTFSFNTSTGKFTYDTSTDSYYYIQKIVPLSIDDEIVFDNIDSLIVKIYKSLNSENTKYKDISEEISGSRYKVVEEGYYNIILRNKSTDSIQSETDLADKITIYTNSNISNDYENFKDEMLNKIEDIEDKTDQLSNMKIDGAYVEDGYLYLTSNDEVIVGNLGPFSGGGGSGGGGESNNAILTVVNTGGWLSKTIAENSNCPITFTWSSIENDFETGDGYIQVFINNISKATINVKQGDVTVDVKNYLSTGKNTIKIKVFDVYGNVKSINVAVKVMTVSISSTFDSSTPISDAFSFTFTPVGALNKTIHFLVDGIEIGTMETALSGRQLSYTIPKQEHGSHTLKVYFDAEVEGQVVTSNSLIYDIICVSGGSDTIITSDFNTTEVTQYTSVNIEYFIYDPSSMTATVDLLVNNEVVSHQTVDRTKQTWTYRFDKIGGFNLKIRSNGNEKLFIINVTDSGIDISAETEALQLYLSSYGRSNNEDNPSVWSYGDLSSILSNFNYKTNGWMMDDDKNTVLRLSGDARIEIPFKIFKDDFRVTGKTIEFEFATREVLNYDAIIISCLDKNRGLQYTAQEVSFTSEQSKIGTQYKEDEHVRLSFVIEKRTENRLIYVYINGVMCGVMQYPVNDNFSQQNPVSISLGSNECTLDIYCIRVYNNDLTRYQVLNNWIADTQNIDEMLDRYKRNDIFDEYGQIVIDKLPRDLPYMIVTCPELPQYKGDKKTCSGSFTNPNDTSKNFTFENAEFNVQGTSSAGYERKNYKAKFKGGFIINGVKSTTYEMNSDAIPTNTFTFKADVASSEGANNVELVRLYNDTCTYKTVPQKSNSKIRQGIDGFPMVIFWDNGETVSFLGKYNFNNDKGTEEVYGFSEGDESWEFLNNTSDRTLFRSDDFSGDDWMNDFEGRYPDMNEDCSNLKQVVSWVASTKDDLPKFKGEFTNWFELDAMVYYYVFTDVFLMVDSRAKNQFLTKIDGSKWFMLPYDFDTAIGINNEGALAFSYNLEDIDQVDGADVYNGQNSVLWVNFRKAFSNEIASTYAKLRTNGIFSYESVIKRFTDHQKVWSEAIFNEDAYFKYIAPLIEKGTSAYLSMLQGDKASQRMWWCYNRFKYEDSKYIAGESTKDIITLRGYAKDNITVTPYADLYITIKYGSYIVQQRANRNKTYTLECPLSNVNDTEIYIYNCSQLSSIGDISGLKVGYAEFSLATKLKELKIGDSSSTYSNTNLKELYLGNNVLLKTIDVRNCPNLTMSVDLSGCTNIEEVYFDGTSVTGVDLPNGGMLRILHLPNTITSLTIRNQKNLEELVIPTLSNISTFWLENIKHDGLSLSYVARNLSPNSRVRFLGFKKESFDTIEEALEVFALYDKMQGLDENGNNVDKAQLSGEIYVPNLTGAQLADIQYRYSDIKVIYDHITSYCYFYSDDGNTLLDTVACVDGSDAVYSKSNPTKSATAQYTFTFSGWSRSIGGSLDNNALKKVEADRQVYAYYSKTVRTYTCRFYNGSTLLQTVYNIPYGSTPKYTGETPVSTEGSAEDYPFEGWSPSLSKGITGNTDYKALFGIPFEEKEITDSWEEIIQSCNDGTYRSKYKVGNYKMLDLDGYGTSKVKIIGIDTDESYDETNISPHLTWCNDLRENLINKGISFKMNDVNETLFTSKKIYATPNRDADSYFMYGNYYTKTYINDYTLGNEVSVDITVHINKKTSYTISISPKTNKNLFTDILLNDEKFSDVSGNTTLYLIRNKECNEGEEFIIHYKLNAKHDFSDPTLYNLRSSAKNNYSSLPYIAINADNSSDESCITIKDTSETQVISELVSINDGNGYINAWKNGILRNETLNKIYLNKLPTILQNNIKNVRKTTLEYKDVKTLLTEELSEKIWVPTENEIDNVYKVANKNKIFDLPTAWNRDNDYWLRGINNKYVNNLRFEAKVRYDTCVHCTDQLRIMPCFCI